MKSRWWLYALSGCLALACLAPFAATSPDGLERVAQTYGFADLGRRPSFRLLADYAFPGISNRTLATALAGVVGVLIVFGLAYGLARLVRSRKGA